MFITMRHDRYRPAYRSGIRRLMMMGVLLPLLTIVLLSTAGAAHPATTLDSANRPSPIVDGQSLDSMLVKRLQSEIEHQIAMNGLEGISASVIVPGKGEWQGVAGMSFDSDAMRPEMILGAGSITKTFTATLILQLAEEGKLTLDDSLHEWLPAYLNIDSTITIRQLLNHTSGIYNYTNSLAWNDSVAADMMRHWEAEEIVSKFIRPRSFQAGIGWQYCNTGYLLLGMIAEKATGSEIAVEFRRRFLTPLGMASTHLEADEESTLEMAHSWLDVDGDAIPDDIFTLPRPAIYSSAWTAGAMFSTARDLTTWGRALYGGQVLHDSSLQRMLTFRNLSMSSMTGYGFGAARIRLSRGVAYGHGGNILGYSSILLFNPADSTVVAAMVNGFVDAAPIGVALMEVIMEQQSGVGSGDIARGALTIDNIRRTSSGQTFAIDYNLPEPAHVSMTVYTILGGEVATIVRDEKSAGTHTAFFDGSNLPRGPYFCRLQAGGKAVTRRLVL